MEIGFWTILFWCFVPIVAGVLATQWDENVSKNGGFHS